MAPSEQQSIAGSLAARVPQPLPARRSELWSTLSSRSRVNLNRGPGNR
jgi:hypothetical protein